MALLGTAMFGSSWLGSQFIGAKLTVVVTGWSGVMMQIIELTCLCG
jgi:hypothetical protein